MALTQKGNRVYARITDLSEESSIQNGDKLLFHSSSTGNASIIDWSNVKINLTNCTFGSEFNQIVEFTSSAESWINTVTESFNELEASCNSIKESLVGVNNEIEALKLIIKMMLGLVNDWDDNTYNKYVSSLSAEAQEIFKAIVSDVEIAQKDARKINFVLSNFMNYSDY